MTGKVFPGSADVYDDQAQVLFNYYRQAAERIVAEEQGLEKQIADTTEDYNGAIAKAEAAHKAMIIWAAAAGVSLVLIALMGPLALAVTAGLAFAAYKQYSDEKAQRSAADECAQRIANLQSSLQGVRRDYRVDKIGVAYVPVAKRVPIGDKSLVVDYTGDQGDTELTLTLLNQPQELRDAMEHLSEHMADMPAVESNEECEVIDTSDYSTSVQDVTLHDYMGTIDRQVCTVHYLIGDSRSASVSIPAIPPESERSALLEEYASTTPSGYPVIPVFDAVSAQRKVEEFTALGELNQQASQDGSGDVTFFTDVMRQLAQGVDMLSRSRTASVSQLTNYSSKIMANVLKASFDQYSPTLEAEEIERIRTATFDYADEVGGYKPFSLKASSRVRYDIFTDAWIADNGSRTALPFGMHQVDAEVLMPVINNLMQENRRERLRVYNEIQDQKTDYLNQWHRDTDDFFGRNRTEANALIQRMNEAYAEYTESYTNYQQQSATFKAMKVSGSLADAEVEEAQNQAQIIEGFQIQASQARAKQDEFTAFMDRIRDDIDESAARFSHIEYYEASLRDFQARENARAAAGVRDLDPRRQGLAAVSAYLAQNGTIPPEPSVSEQLDRDFTINLSGQAEAEIASLGDLPQGYGATSGQEVTD